MILLLVALSVGWVLLNVFAANREAENASLYYVLLSLGSVGIVVVLVGVVLYLSLTIKAINLNKRQSNFVDSVTHELKSPIASLKLYLQTLNRRQVDEKQRESFHRYMLDDVERLDLLINHLLDAGRVDRPEVEKSEEDVELGAVLKDCVETVCARYRVSPETVTLHLEPVWIRARRVDLLVLFRNLIDNAVKYAGSPPEVKVHCVLNPGETVSVQICDNGQGIPPRHRRRVFKRFVRLGLELEREKPGTGLGLHIVRTLVHRLKGKIRVRDVAGGSTGTVFEVTLPALVKSSPAAELVGPSH